MIKCLVIIIIFFLLFLLSASPGKGSTNITYQYDSNGNLLSDSGHFYEYNEANQLIRIRYGNQSGPVISEYFYDYRGQRIKKIENGVTTYYIDKHFETRSFNGESLATSYYFAGPERIAKKTASGNMFYYHSDHLGSTTALSDQGGTVSERIGYYPFGEKKEGGPEKYTYTGKEADAGAGLYYYEARYYKPGFFHFTQADTVQPNIYDPQDLNKYAYAGNNPLRFVDPSGHSKVGSNEWTSDFSRASKYDRAKFERMKKEYGTWASSGGIQFQANDVYYAEYVKRTNKLYTAAYLTKKGADISLDVFGDFVPGGKLVASVYDLTTTGIEILPKYFSGTYGRKDVVKDLGTIGIKLGSSRLNKTIEKFDGISEVDRYVSQKTFNYIVKEPVEWGWGKIFGD